MLGLLQSQRWTAVRDTHSEGTTVSWDGDISMTDNLGDDKVHCLTKEASGGPAMTRSSWQDQEKQFYL